VGFLAGKATQGELKVSIVTDIPWSLCVYVSACLLDITMGCAKKADAVWDVD